MKKSFFKRAFASAVAVPLALTQCLVPALAVETTDSSDATVKQFVTDDLLAVAGNKYNSEWNDKVDAALTSFDNGAEAALNDLSAIYDVIVSNAGIYSDIAEGVCNGIANETVSFNNGTFTISGQIEDLSSVIGTTAQDRIDKQISDIIDSYGDKISEETKASLEGIADAIDSVPMSADITISANFSKVADSKSVEVSYAITTEDGNTYAIAGDNSVFDYVVAKFADIKEAVFTKKNEAFADIRAELDKAQAQVADAQAQVADAEAKLADAEAKLADAKADLDEAESTGVNVDEARAEWEAKNAEVEEAKAELADAKVQIADAEAELAQAEVDYVDKGGEADQKIEEIFARYESRIETISNKVNNAVKIPSRVITGATLEEALKEFESNHPNYANQIPTSATIVAEQVSGAYENLLSELTGTIIPADVTIDVDIIEVANMFDSLTDVTFSVAENEISIVGYTVDAETEDAKEFFNNEDNADRVEALIGEAEEEGVAEKTGLDKYEAGMVLTETVKLVEATIPLELATSNSGSVSYDVTRIYTFEEPDETTTTTTTTTESTTSTETTTATGEDTSSSTETTTGTGEDTSSSTETTTAIGEDTSSSTETTTGTGEDTSSSTETTTATGDDTSSSTETTTGTGDDTSSSTETTTGTGDDTSSSTETTTGTGDDTSSSTETTTSTDDESSTSTETTTTIVIVNYGFVFEGDSAGGGADGNFYYSHDDETQFAAVGYDAEGNVVPLENYTLNYNTPYEAFVAEGGDFEVAEVDMDYFKYTIELYDEEERLLATTDVYIGKLGDADLDNKVNSSDASRILAYYGALSSNRDDALLSDTDELAESFAQFLAETNVDGAWDSSDASNVLDFYARSSSDAAWPVQTNIKEFWTAKIA